MTEILGTIFKAIRDLLSGKSKKSIITMPDLSKLTRSVNLLVIHCSATPPNMDIGAKEIRRWHKAKGWSDIGYHDVIRRDGSYERGRDYNRIGAHVRGYNRGSIGVCMVGGVDEYNNPEDNFTDEQWESLTRYCRATKAQINVSIAGHNEFDKGKACPSFDVQRFLEAENI